MPRQSLLLVVRGLVLVLLLTLFLLRVATPRTYVTPGARLTPAGLVKQGGEAAPDRPAGAGQREGAEDAERSGTE